MSIRNKLREWVRKGLLPSSGEPGERPVRIIYGGEKDECPIIPVQLCMETVTQLEISFTNFLFFDSQAAFIQLNVNEAMMLHECAIKL